jgi:hypothetical protein
MDTSLVRVVCANCDANYRIPGEIVRGKVADFCCSNCGSVIEVNGMAIEMVAPTRPGGHAEGPVILTPAPPTVQAAPLPPVALKSETPPYYMRAKSAAVPPPPTEAFAARRSVAEPRAGAPSIPQATTPTIPLRAVTSAAAAKAASAVTHSSMPPPMSVPLRGESETLRPTRIPSDIPAPLVGHDEESRGGKGWMIFGTIAAAIAVGFLGRTLSSSSSSSAQGAAAELPAAEPPSPVSTRLQASDFRGTNTDPALSANAPPTGAQALAVSAKPTAQEINVESLKPERRKKKASKTKGNADNAESVETTEEEAAPSPSIIELSNIAPPAPAPAPEGVEFNRDAAQSALEDAAALAATCRQEDTPSGAVRVAVTFVATGKVTQALVESGPVRGTPTGSCVASKFRTAQIPAFSGARVTVHKTLSF